MTARGKGVLIGINRRISNELLVRKQLGVLRVRHTSFTANDWSSDSKLKWRGERVKEDTAGELLWNCAPL